MKLSQVLQVLPSDLAADITEPHHNRDMKRKEMVTLEQRLFEIQEGLEYSKAVGRKRVQDIRTLNDIRNVILDELEVNDPHPHLRWPNVERMKKRMM